MRMLPNTPMLANASDWSGPTSSPAHCCRLATTSGAWLTRSTVKPNPASRDWSSARTLVSWSSRFGASTMNWLIDDASVADAWTRIASRTITIARYTMMTAPAWSIFGISRATPLMSGSSANDRSQARKNRSRTSPNA